MAAKAPADLAFRVVTIPGGYFVDGYAEQTAAEASAIERNARAAEMGINTRYEAVTK